MMHLKTRGEYALGERRNSGECRLFWILVHRGPRRCVGPRGISARASPSRRRTRGAAERRTHSSRIVYRYATRTSQQMTVLCQTPDSPEPAPRTRTSCGSRTSPSPGSRRARCTCRRSSTATTAFPSPGRACYRCERPFRQRSPTKRHRPSRYVTHLRIGNAVRDLNLVPHGISVSDWSKSHNRSIRRIGSADGPLTSTPYLAADEVRSLG